MRILLVLDSYPPDLNGGAYFTHRLAKSLLKMNNEVMVLGPSLSFKSYFDKYDGVNVYRFSSFSIRLLYPNFRIINPFNLNSRVKKIVEDFKPDIIHLQGKFILGNAVFKFGKKNHIPMIATNHLTPQNFTHHFKVPSFFVRRFNNFVWNWAFEMLRQIPIVTSPTISGAKLMQENGFKQNIEVVSCGIDLGRFFPGAPENEFKNSYKIPDKLILLYTGRLDKEKNIDTIIRAVAIALQKVDFHFILTGNGKEENNLKSLAQKLDINDNVQFLGKIPEDLFPKVYRVADAFVNGGEVELQCISALEAIASGLPVLLANRLALPELVSAPVSNGFLYEPKDDFDLSQKIIHLFTDVELRKTMGKQSLTVAKNHDINACVLEFERLYRLAISQQINLKNA